MFSAPHNSGMGDERGDDLDNLLDSVPELPLARDLFRNDVAPHGLDAERCVAIACPHCQSSFNFSKQPNCSRHLAVCQM